MRIKYVIIALIAALTTLGSCAEETCPVATKADYHVKKKIKVVRHKSKRRPTPSLIHITRVNYKPDRKQGY